MLKDDGLFYMVLGSYITSHNYYTADMCERGLERMMAFLDEIPADETEDIRIVKESMEVIEMELKKCLEKQQLNMDREGRKRIFEENLEIFAEGKYTTEEGRDVKLKVYDSDYYDEPFELEEEAPVEGGTRFLVVNEDCVESYKAMLWDMHNPVLLNMASATHPGGGVEKGSGAQEEQLCRRSTLLLSLYQYKREKAKIYPQLNIKYREKQYPLHPQFGGIYSPKVTFFREGEGLGYRLSDEPFFANVITVAGVSHPPLDKNGLMYPREQEQTKNKIRTILRIALEHYHDSIVLGALGCGAFANPPAQVAKLFHEVFEEPEFKDQFKKVVFAILEDKNSRRNSSTGNYLPFKKEFEPCKKNTK